MPANRFDTSANQEYVSQYVPMPFDAMYKVGTTMQAKYDEGAKAVEDLGALGAAIKAAPMYAENKTKFVNEYNDKSKALVEKYASDFGNPEFKREINNLTTEFKSRPEISAFTNTLKSFEDWQSQKKDAKNAMNLDYTYDMDPNNASNFRQRDVIKEGVYSPKMTQFEDWNETGKKVMGKIAEDSTVKELGLNLGNTRINNGETEVWSRKTGKYEGVSSPKLKNLSNLMIGEYANTVAGKHHLQSLLGQDVDYSQISRMAQSGNEQAIKTKAAIDQEFENHLYRSNASQIGQKTETTYDDQFITNRAAQKANEIKEEFAGPMPTYQNPLATTGTTLTPKSGLGWLGINVDVINNDGSLNSKAYESRGTNLIKDVKENKDGSVIVTDIYGNKSTHKTLTDAYSEFKKKPAPNLLTEHYTNLINTARGLGLEIPKKSNDKSKTDFDELQKQLSKYGQNMQQQGNTSAGLQSRFGNNLSNELLGNVTVKEDGTTVFKKSPLLGGAKIVDQSTGEVISSNKEEVAKDGAIRGINYFAPEAGTYRMDSKNKAYNYNPGDNTLNKMTQNTHSLTQDIVKARQGKQNSKTIIDNDNNTVGDYANNIVNSLKENFKTIPANNPQGLMLANHLNENLTKLNGYEPVSVKTSDILIQEGPRRGSPKYNYVAYEHKGFGTTNEADDKILRVDAESGQTEIMTLGDIHASERDYLQQNYAGAFEPTK